MWVRFMADRSALHHRGAIIRRGGWAAEIARGRADYRPTDGARIVRRCETRE